jgi:hypothetical protein
MKRPALLHAAAAFLLLALGASCGGHDRDGSLCARCGAEDPCQATALLTAPEDIRLFCGDDTSPQNCNICHRDADDVDDNPDTLYVCEVSLGCVHQRSVSTNAQQCYPFLAPPLSGPHPDYECDGEKPQV